MAEDKLRVLYVSSEIAPFLKKTEVAKYVRSLPEAMQQRGMEVRILVPRFGVINERKNRLHEVVRLSGINISVGEEDRPITIKVASIPQARMQAYFIDNDELFHRKQVFVDKQEKPFEDNHERAIFFCKGVIETVQKLGWAPDIIHCNDWVSGLVPLYVKTAYKKDPLFKNTKAVFTMFNTLNEQTFEEADLRTKILMEDVKPAALKALDGKPTDQTAFLRLACAYSDHVTASSQEAHDAFLPAVEDVLPNNKLTVIPEDENLNDAYEAVYQNVLEAVN